MPLYSSSLWKISGIDDTSEEKSDKYKKEKKNEGLPFLSAHYDPLAGVVTLPQHVILADVHNDGESKLVVGHVNDGISGFKLKLFSQTSLVQSPSLLSLPSAVTSFNIANGVTGK